jgi:DNA polymerase I-like protein with 3'-5' exonuclease and polymerase domains
MNLLFLGTVEDTGDGTPHSRGYLHALKPLLGVGNPCRVLNQKVTTWAEVKHYCQKHDIHSVICTQAGLIPKLSGEDYGTKLPSLDNYAGSLFTRDDIEVVFVPPLAHIYSVPYGEFLLTRYISKLTKRDQWYTAPEFTWELLTPATADNLYRRFSDAQLIAVDIETIKTPVSITCIGYCAAWCNTDGTISSHSIVLPMDSEWAVSWMRKFNTLSAPKVLQNGKYDINYLMAYNAPVTNWLFDTATAMHCWYSELPKDLSAVAAFLIRNARYWKHLGSDTSIRSEQYYLYNALDVYNTVHGMLSWLLEAPAYAKNNYAMEFPLNYPCIVSELTGLKRDLAVQAKQVTKLESSLAVRTAKLQAMTVPNFNANSPKQVLALLKILGCGDLTSSDEANINKASFRHPLNERILGDILEIRGERKLVSTYFGKEYKGRILYSLIPHGTDTGRLASKEHHFWCGLQLQNIPRGNEVKCTLQADEGFLIGEADYAQAESRDTAYITGDTKLIAAVTGTKDFHSLNASAFFGVPYEEIFDDATGKQLDKDLRDLSKRTNHGANYCMGAAIMLETMGIRKVLQAQRLLGLPMYLTPIQVTQHLLDSFAGTYPIVATRYPDWVTATVLATRKLVGATGWTRYCFNNPKTDKRARNGYVAHNPQSLNAMTLNKAFMSVFYTVWLPHNEHFKLYGQIHDSILFGYRKGYEHLATMVKDCMEFDVPVTDISGTTRTLRVPVDLKLGMERWGKLPKEL